VFANSARRTSKYTAEALEEYKQLIDDTVETVKEHLQGVNEYLQTVKPSQTTIGTGTETGAETVRQRQLAEEEKKSAFQCLDICTQVSSHLGRIEQDNFANSINAAHTRVSIIPDSQSPRILTILALSEARQRIDNTKLELEKNMGRLSSILDKLTHKSRENSEANMERSRIQENIDSFHQCLDVCSTARKQAPERSNIFDDVTASEDAQQIIASINGDLIKARKVKAEARADQWLGQLPEQVLTKLSEDRVKVRTANKFDTKTEPEISKEIPYEERFGPGHKASG
jgi:hypothetical protein